MRSLLLFVIVLFLFISTAFSQASTSTQGPQDTVRKFYTWYLHRLNIKDETPLKNRTVSLQYLTPEFLNSVPRLTRKLDADAIICAQDFEETWEKDLDVESPVVNGNTATALVQLGAHNPDRVKLKVSLKHIKSGWRINGVDCGAGA